MSNVITMAGISSIKFSYAWRSTQRVRVLVCYIFHVQKMLASLENCERIKNTRSLYVNHISYRLQCATGADT